MGVEITPELSLAERRALLQALQQANRHEQTTEPYRQAWRVAGLREAVDGEDAEVRYAFPPRSTRGATRA